VLQAFRTSHMFIQPVRVFPYFKHFLFFVVMSHLILAAFYCGSLRFYVVT